MLRDLCAFVGPFVCVEMGMLFIRKGESRGAEGRGCLVAMCLKFRGFDRIHGNWREHVYLGPETKSGGVEALKERTSQRRLSGKAM